MEKYFEVLRKCPLFMGISDENLISILVCLGATMKTYEKKETIFSEGEPAKYIGIVLSGAVQIVQMDYLGNRNIVANIEAAELFGESFACAGVEAIPMDVVAREDTEVLLIDCLRITQTCSSACEFHRRMIYNLMKLVAMKNIIFHQKIEIISKRSTREKLMTYLVMQAKKNKSTIFEIPYGRQELADFLGVDRSGLSVEIGKLCKEGVIRSKKRWFEIVGDGTER